MTKTLTFQGYEGLNKTLRYLPSDLGDELRVASGVISKRVVMDAQRRAHALGGVAALVGPTLRPGSTREPKVMLGNSKKLPPRNGRPRRGKRQTFGDVIWGAEFGGGRRATTHQFQPWRGNGREAGYFLWPAIRADEPVFVTEYYAALDAAVDQAARRAGGR